MMPLSPNTLPAKGTEAYIFTDLQKLLRGRTFVMDTTWPKILSGAATIITTDDHVGVMDVMGRDESILFDARRGAPGTWQSRALMIRVAAGARLTMVRITDQPGAVTDQIHVVLGAGATAQVLDIQSGNILARTDWRVDLTGAGARFDFTGLQHLSSGAHGDISMVIDHQTPDTVSTQTIRSVVASHATGVFQGRIQVAPGAVRTDARQNAKAILLAPAAQMNIKPELEIFADDVACAHGATVGALDPDQIFYLTSRGVAPDAARTMLIQAFLRGVIPPMPDALSGPISQIIGGYDD